METPCPGTFCGTKGRTI